MSNKHRSIHNLLVANRGEIATRLMSAAREHSPPITVYAVASESDRSHTLTIPTSHVLDLPSASDHLNIDLLIRLAKQHNIDAVHPGYGFLSESADFARRMRDEAGAVVIGPGPEILQRTGDKLAARRLAEECSVPVLPALLEPTSRVENVRGFAEKHGFPVMIKAVDGGGGRGIRLVREPKDLEALFKRAVAESPSRQVFVERAALDGFRHIEVQILGDGTGKVCHLWERECSIQRRYQKIVEIAPSPARRVKSGNEFVAGIIDAAMRMARHVRYLSVGTFEFLANPDSKEFFFLEVNPRLQVEHTITEQVAGVDIVEAQLRIAEGRSLLECNDGIGHGHTDGDEAFVSARQPPSHFSIQLRVTAEDPQRSFSLSIGRIKSFSFPSGNGVRVETSLASGHDCAVSADFDSLLAKVIVTGRSWPQTCRRAQRALEDTRIDGVKTNLMLLRAIVASDDFMADNCDTQWLEKNVDNLIQRGESISTSLSKRQLYHPNASSGESALSGMSSSTVLLRKGDAWNLALEPQGEQKGVRNEQHSLRLTRVLRNEFPSLLSAELEYTTPGSREPSRYRVAASATSAAGLASRDPSARKGDASKPGHIIAPFSGKLVEILVDEGNYVHPGQVVCVIKQMKMELEVRAGAQQKGLVTWVTEAEDGAELGEGMLIAELDTTAENHATPKL